MCDNNNKYYTTGSIQTSKWKYNIPKGAEALIILNFIKEVKRNTDYLKEGSIKVYNDNLKMIQDINEDAHIIEFTYNVMHDKEGITVL